MRLLRVGVFAATAHFGAPILAYAQISAPGRPVEQRVRPRVFFDCSGPITCQPDLHRIEIPWVSWVNDPEDADVHIISTRQDLAGGSIRMTVNFQGLGAMAHLTDEFAYTSPGTDVMRSRQDGFTQALRLGLLRYALEGGLGSELDVAFVPLEGSPVDESAAEGLGLETDVYDPWNYWTFRVGLSGNLSGREARSNNRVNLNFNTDRITEDWKFTFSSNATLQRERIELSGGRITNNDRDSWNVGTILVRSLGQHVSAGFDFSGGKQDTNNRDARFSVNPAMEWNYYPYDETGRRQLIVHYGAGLEHASYDERTVYGVTHETVGFHRVGIQYSAVELWGTAGVSADASQYLHRSGLYSFGIQGNLTLRIVRGLDLSLSASGSRIADEINIPEADLSDEDILLGRRQLPTSYNYQASLGFNYRFGSIFANIVNARFPSSVR